MSDLGASDFSLNNARSLYQAGRLPEAARLFHDVLRVNPRHFEALHTLGIIYFHSGQFQHAQYLLDEALKIDPTNLEGLCFRGLALIELKRYDLALVSFDRALAIDPDFIHARCNRAIVLFDTKRLEEALAEYDHILAIKPDHAISLHNRGNTLEAMGRLEEAVASFDKALAIQPDFAAAAEHRDLLLFKLDKLTRAPAFAMRALFDDFAPRFDETMLETLGYRGHLHLRTLATRVLPRLSPPLRILDLGVGTGLVGGAFRDLAAGGRLDGIDVAPRMIEAARARGIYDDLILGDLETVLHGRGPSYDLIVSADTMVYIGDLARAFSGVAKRLVPAGFYLFTAESKEGEGWEQAKTKRYRHAESYLRAEAAHAGLEFTDIVKCLLRREYGEPVPGFAVALRKPGAHPPPA
jgi:predicted TPR repeat methyltransferase